MTARCANLATVLLLVLLATACTEENAVLVTDVGTVGFVLTDPDISPQVVNAGPPEETIQVMEWKLTAPAELTRDSNGVKDDLLFDEPCIFVQTIQSGFNPEGRCSAGIILGSSDDTGAALPQDVSVTLDLQVQWMQVRRAEPVFFPYGGDPDADGVVSGQDNCIMQPNPGQEDSNGDGVGDVCTVPDLNVPDNDGDGVPDGSDNCVWVQNPFQEDTRGTTEQYGIPDGIGDACTEQRIDDIRIVPADLQRSFTISLSTGGLSFVTVDFSSDATLTCYWNDGYCDLETAEVKACGIISFLDVALRGCL